MTLKKLIAELEAATEGSRELDRQISETLDEPLLIYTESVDAALTLLPQGYTYCAGSPDWSGTEKGDPPSAGGWANCFRGHDGEWHLCTAATPVLALCITFLKARQEAANDG